jgi:N-acetyl-anhydromuramyl-L-alanine amidase AmpD
MSKKNNQEIFSKNCDERDPSKLPIDTVVIHSMFAPFASDPIDPLQCAQWLEECEVSSHYLISATGAVYQLVPEHLRAWHAGRSRLPNTDRDAVNHFSIGIELLNKPEQPYTEEQLCALESLLLALKSRWPIKNIYGHKHIAIDRNTENSIDNLKLSAGDQTKNSKQARAEFMLKSKNEAKTDPWNFPWQRLKDFLRLNYHDFQELTLPED